LFSHELEAVLTLSFFIPLIIGTGGNAGSQTVTTVIRALALQQIHAACAAPWPVRTGLRSVGAGRRRLFRVQLWGVGTRSPPRGGTPAVCLWANVVGAGADRGGRSASPNGDSAPLLYLVDATGPLIYLSIAGFVLSRV
jgi:magnesium transporter